jgi:serine/threonine protein kinase
MTKEELSVESFKIVRKIGKGRFGSVFLAQHIKSQAVIALKVLSKAQIKEEQM